MKENKHIPEEIPLSQIEDLSGVMEKPTPKYNPAPDLIEPPKELPEFFVKKIAEAKREAEWNERLERNRERAKREAEWNERLERTRERTIKHEELEAEPVVPQQTVPSAGSYETDEMIGNFFMFIIPGIIIFVLAASFLL